MREGWEVSADVGVKGFLHRKHDHPAEPRPDAKRVLSIDGGGIRGIIPAMLIAEIERRADAPACELFDLIAGTSTGGIIAMGLAVPDADGKPAFSAADGVAIYEDQGPKIFSRAPRDVMHSLGGVLHERYHAEGLVQILRQVFGDLCLSAALTDVLLASYEVTRRETFIFSSRLAKVDPHHDFPMWAAVRSTTAAPTFFPPHQVTDPGGRTHVFIDGAVFANSPAMCAFAEIEREHLGSDVVITSVGAGDLSKCFEYEQVHEWGAAQWARPLLEIVLDGAAETSDHVLGELLGASRYYRFQRKLTEASEALDNVKPANLRALRREGQRLIDESSERIDDLCQLLVR